jgi:hypothetical protein
MKYTEAEYLDLIRRRGCPTMSTVSPGPVVRASKFGAVICEADGIKFRSKKERARYLELCALKSAGACWFLRQVPFYLPGNTKYTCDFMVFWQDGKVSVEDVKGKRLPAFIRSKKQVEALYPVRIEEV